MQISEEMAVRLHRMMWSDMQRELGDNLCSGRATYKAEWLAKHFPGEHFMHNCFLCEYVMQQTGIRPLLECAECKLCPIKWPGDNCSLRERDGGVNYLQSPISDILALPARNPELDGKISVRASLGDKIRADMLERLCNQIKECLAVDSGLPASATVHDHVKRIKEKAVQQSTFSKMYCDAKTELAKASGLPEADTITDHIKAIKEMAATPDEHGYKEVKKLLSDASGLEDFFTVSSHIKAIQEKAVDDYFAKMPLAKAMTTDIDEAFKQHAEEQKAPIFHALAEASGLSATNKSVNDHISKIKAHGVREGRLEVAQEIYGKLAETSGLHESNHDVQDHISKIIEKTRKESADCTRKFMAKYSGEFWDRFTVVGHIEKIKRDANAKYVYASSLLEKYKNALSNESGLDRDKPIDVHLREIVKNSMEVGAAEERDRIQEKIYEELLS